MSEGDGAARRAALRAIWAWSGKDQAEFAEDAGLSYDRFRASMSKAGRVPAPTVEELLQAARAANVPDRFAIYGWEPDLVVRFARLESCVAVLSARSEDESGMTLDDLARKYGLPWPGQRGSSAPPSDEEVG